MRDTAPNVPELDPLALKFAIAVRNSTRPAVAIGCGNGAAVAAALARGAHVVAADPDARALFRLFARVPAEQHPRLRARLCDLPNLDFKAASFAAVHAARRLHRLKGMQLKSTLSKFFRWLYPQGTLFLSVPMHEELALLRALDAADFLIEDVSSHPLSCDNGQICCAVVAKCSA